MIYLINYARALSLSALNIDFLIYLIKYYIYIYIDNLTYAIYIGNFLKFKFNIFRLRFNIYYYRSYISYPRRLLIKRYLKSII